MTQKEWTRMMEKIDTGFSGGKYTFDDSQDCLSKIRKPMEKEMKSIIASMEKAAYHYINEERVRYNLPTFIYDPGLAHIGRLHSQDMAENDFFSHTNLKGQTPADRAREYHISYCLFGECIAYMSTGNSMKYGHLAVDDYDKIAAAIVNEWMNSPKHKAVIVDRYLIKIGISIAYKRRKYYVTADFSA